MFSLMFKLWNKYKVKDGEVVWVNPLLLADKDDTNLKVGSLTISKNHRLSVVVKKGGKGSIREMSPQEEANHILVRALKLGMSVKFRYMTIRFQVLMLGHRFIIRPARRAKQWLQRVSKSLGVTMVALALMWWGMLW